MKDSGLKWVGQIPAGWEVCHLKYLLTNNDGGVWGKDPTDVEGEIVVRSTEQTIDGHWRIEEPARRDLRSCGDLTKSRIRVNDLLITKSSGSKDHIGKTTIAGDYFEEHICYYSNFLQRLRVVSEASPFFVWYFLNSSLARSQFVYQQNATIGIGNINSQNINDLFILLPPLPEQRAIAARLDELTGRIESESKKIAAEIERLEQYKKAFITEAVCGRCIKSPRPMKDSGIPWVGKIPEEWGVKKIASLYELRSSKVSDKDYPPLSVTMKGVLPQLETVAKTNDGDNRKLVRAGDFAINSRSDRRGACGIAKQDGSVSLINIVLKPRGEMVNQYFDWLFHTVGFADEFYKWGTGIVADMWSTRWSAMKKIAVPFPPLAEQREIAAAIDATCAKVDAIVAKRKRQLDRLDALKRSLVYEYVTGKKDIEIEDRGSTK